MVTQLLPGIWTIESELKLLPGVRLPLRAIVVQDREGDLTLISPVRGVEAWGDEVERLGVVKNIVAPSGFHHLFALAAHERFPEATLWASRALKRKRPDFPDATRWLEGSDIVEMESGLKALPLNGMPALQEWAFFHEDSATLIVVDLLFNVLQPGIGLGLFQRGFGTYKRLAVSRLFKRACKDEDALAKSARTLLALPFENLVMAHGEPIVGGAKEVTRKALSERISLDA